MLLGRFGLLFSVFYGLIPLALFLAKKPLVLKKWSLFGHPTL